MLGESYVFAALYKFVALPDYKQRKKPLLEMCKENGIKGTILLANEGINGTISGSRAGIDSVLAWLRSDPLLADLEYKESFASEQAFYRMKIKLKKEIVTMGAAEVDPNKTVGTYIKPKDWNALISDPDVLLLDARNQYEVDIGTFKDAIDPEITTFREFPAYVQKHLNPDTHTKVAMFCTGGIRCEKASSFMRHHGFEEVYHLKGGILKYLEEIPTKESLWNGECFVFDNRVSVGNGLIEGSYDQCHGCRHPISDDDKASEKYQLGVSCPHCYDNLTDRKRQRATERQYQVELAEARDTIHIGEFTDYRE